MPCFRWGAAVIALLALHANVCRAQFGATLVNGRTRLLGNSFGLPGNATFDYVIVGAGTAGLTLARRLAEDPGTSVAVIEPGSYYEITNGNHSQVPVYDIYSASTEPTDIQPLVDWGLITTPQEQLKGQKLHYAQGKCLGGSSARNYLAYQRGTIDSYQKWADLVEDQSYEFKNILPFFEKSVTFTPPNYQKRAGPKVPYDPTVFSPNGAPLQVSYANYYQPFSDGLKEGFSKSGLDEINGLNSGRLIGFSEFAVTVDPTTETRSSSETSFLHEALAKTGLLVYQQTLAKRITFDAQKVATGVLVSTAGINYKLSARKEVIVAAGAFRSPQLLMTSGIGPAQKLNDLKISVVSDLAGVGQNLWDQPLFGVSYQVNVPTNSRLIYNATFAAQAVEEYLQHQKGPLCGSSGNFVGWEKLPQAYRKNLTAQAREDLQYFPSDWPELEIIATASSLATIAKPANYASLSVAIVAPTSRGNVTINSTDTTANPVISPNWLLTNTDKQVAVQSFRRLRQIFAATGLAVGQEVTPGPDVQSDDEILSYIQSTVSTIHHAAGTCKMGTEGDPMAVVNSCGKVFGVSQLRVIDSSIFPILPPGHPQATVYMLAEKLAQNITSA